MLKKAFLEGEILIKLAISDFENSCLKVFKLFDCSKGTTIRQPLFIFFKFSTKHLTGKWTNGERKGHGGPIFREEDQVALYTTKSPVERFLQDLFCKNRY